MKKVYLVLFFLLFCPAVFAVDAMDVEIFKSYASNDIVLKIDITDTPSLTLESQYEGINAALRGWYCYLAEIIPGTGADQPTDEYDIVILNTVGTDIFGGALADRSNTANATVLPTVSSTYKGPFPIKYDNTDALTVTVTNNVATGKATIYLYFTKY